MGGSNGQQGLRTPLVKRTREIGQPGELSTVLWHLYSLPSFWYNHRSQSAPPPRASPILGTLANCSCISPQSAVRGASSLQPVYSG